MLAANDDDFMVSHRKRVGDCGADATDGGAPVKRRDPGDLHRETRARTEELRRTNKILTDSTLASESELAGQHSADNSSMTKASNPRQRNAENQVSGAMLLAFKCDGPNSAMIASSGLSVSGLTGKRGREEEFSDLRHGL